MASFSFGSLILLSAIFRFVLILYGEWQDAHMEVRYTDVDYIVFSDAASLMASGKSPYLRSTYRYSPLLAFLLVPNSLVHRCWGKFLFSASGILTFSLDSVNYNFLLVSMLIVLFRYRFASRVLYTYYFEETWRSWKFVHWLCYGLAFQPVYVYYWYQRKLRASCLCNGS